MPMTIMVQPDGAPKPLLDRDSAGRRHFTHKRLERWIRLQQFVYGLPDDYAYAVCVSDKDGRAESQALVAVGWMTWFGAAKGSDRQHALALALLEASEALSANGTRVFFHGLKGFAWRVLRFWKPKAPETLVSRREGREEEDRLAS